MDWFNIKKKGNPTDENDYLIHTKDGYDYVASWHRRYKNQPYFSWVIRCECAYAEDCLLIQDDITHWMLLPNAPKDE